MLKINSSGSEGKYLEVYITIPNIITFYPFGPLGPGTVSALLLVVLLTVSMVNLISMVTLFCRLEMEKFLKLLRQVDKVGLKPFQKS